MSARQNAGAECRPGDSGLAAFRERSGRFHAIDPRTGRTGDGITMLERVILEVRGTRPRLNASRVERARVRADGWQSILILDPRMRSVWIPASWFIRCRPKEQHA